MGELEPFPKNGWMVQKQRNRWPATSSTALSKEKKRNTKSHVAPMQMNLKLFVQTVPCLVRWDSVKMLRLPKLIRISLTHCLQPCLRQHLQLSEMHAIQLDEADRVRQAAVISAIEQLHAEEQALLTTDAPMARSPSKASPQKVV